MDRLRARVPGSVEDPLADEIALGRRAGSDQVRLVGGARAAHRGPPPSRPRPGRCRARAGSEDPDRDTRRDSQPGTFEEGSHRWNVFSRSRDASGSADRCPRRPCPCLLLYAGTFRTTVLGDGGLLRRDGHRLARRPDRAQAWRDLATRLAARSDRRQVLVLAVLVMLIETESGRPGWSPRSWHASF